MSIKQMSSRKVNTQCLDTWKYPAYDVMMQVLHTFPTTLYTKTNIHKDIVDLSKEKTKKKTNSRDELSAPCDGRFLVCHDFFQPVIQTIIYTTRE